MTFYHNKAKKYLTTPNEFFMHQGTTSIMKLNEKKISNDLIEV